MSSTLRLPGSPFLCARNISAGRHYEHTFPICATLDAEHSIHRHYPYTPHPHPHHRISPAPAPHQRHDAPRLLSAPADPLSQPAFHRTVAAPRPPQSCRSLPFYFFISLSIGTHPPTTGQNIILLVFRLLFLCIDISVVAAPHIVL